VTTPTLDNILEKASALPTLPEVATFIITSIDDERADADSLVEHLNTDPAVVARLLAAANSAAYGLPTRVDAVRDAIMLLGLENVRRITLATTVIDRYQHGSAAFDPRLLWRHSLGVALCASTIAEHAGYRAETAFTAGLLHDIGQLLLFASVPELFGAAIERRQRLDESITTAETTVLGFDHAVAGAALARLWHLPADIVDGINGHHDPESGDFGEMGDVIHVAEALSHALDLGELANNRVPQISEDSCARLGIEWSGFSRHFGEIEARYDEILLALGLY
jgi:putative nucleotidyltransferase with HDIG domain